ncbi:DUF485 domain-containing protein [bacterium]|jgi:uncharacterized membrane protein (DUF485 family)|nr:DUF485 domain-containing protein [bacterium]
MAELMGGPTLPTLPSDPATERRNARIGQKLFLLYAAAYGGFIFINAFYPSAMEQTPFAGINLAILYGMGLVIGAWIVSLVYGWLCRRPVTDRPQEETR